MKFNPTQALEIALNPKSIAVIGASDNPNKIGGRPLAYMAKFGYKGVVYPINPQRSQVQGFKSYPSLESLPQTPEVAVIAVPGELAVQAVFECAEMGVACCIIMSSGFAETSQEGREQERQMVERARQTGMRLVGPNSQGMANFSNGAVASFSTMFSEVEHCDGPLGIISQSGAMSVIPYGMLRSRSIGVRHSHATGNDCDVTVCELASVVAQDPALKLLILYLEGIPDPWNLARAANIANQRDLPIVVLKSGRTALGQQAAQSHTGALANEDKTVDAFLKEHGIWRAQNIREMIDTAPLYLQGWRPRGRRLVAISNSGAVCVLTADAAANEHLPMQPLSKHTQDTLKTILPGFATTTNPVDITAALLSNSRLLGDILPPIAKDPAADAFLIGIAVAGTGYDLKAFAQDSKNFADSTGKPLVIAASQPVVAEHFKKEGLLVYPTEAEAVQALSSFLSHRELIASLTQRNPAIPWPGVKVADEQMLDETQSLGLLRDHGVAVVPHQICHTLGEALACFELWGDQVVVLKGCTKQASHKSELGLVKLHITNQEQLTDAYTMILSNAQKNNVTLEGIIIAQQLKGERELMIGARLDPVFGAVVMLGDGGKYVEAMPDVQVLLAPLTKDSIQRALERLRIYPLFKGVRGEPGLDAEAFMQCAMRVSDLMCNQSSDAVITQIDINPFIVGAPGAGCHAVDAVVYRARAV
jgi:acyl-CoA synthetase (NDP forming)